MMYNTGQEITIPYDHTLVMKNMQFRHLRLGFMCRCELCQEEEIKNDDELYDKFQNLEEISEKIREKYYDNHPPTKDMMKNAKKLEEFLNDNEKALEISKQMYNLARIKRAPKGFIFDLIKNGIEHAADGYKNTKDNIEFANRNQYFKNEGKKLVEIGQQIIKICYGNVSPADFAYLESYSKIIDHWKEYANFFDD